MFRFPFVFATILASASMLMWSHASFARIIDGTPSVFGDFPEVFAITQSDDVDGKLCTATLVHPRVLLTSAHCLPATKTPGDRSSAPILITSAIDARGAPVSVIANESYRHRVYASSHDEFQRTAFDVGIILLSKDLGKKTAPLASLELASVREAAFETDALLAVGYGGTATLFEDLTTGIQRSAPTRAIESTTTILTTDGPSGGLSKGDDGGPVFLVDSQGARSLVGVANGPSSSSLSDRTGLPDASLYAGMRREIACWISLRSGYALPGISKDLACEAEKKPVKASGSGFAAFTSH